jgi:hypothetical protein
VFPVSYGSKIGAETHGNRATTELSKAAHYHEFRRAETE